MSCIVHDPKIPAPLPGFGIWAWKRGHKSYTAIVEDSIRVHLPICRVNSSGISLDILLNSSLERRGMLSIRNDGRRAARTHNELVRNSYAVREGNLGPLFLSIRRRQNNILKLLWTRIGPSDQWLLVVWSDSRLVFGIQHGDYG